MLANDYSIGNDQNSLDDVRNYFKGSKAESRALRVAADKEKTKDIKKEANSGFNDSLEFYMQNNPKPKTYLVK